MKKKNKILAGVLAGACVLGGAFALTGCESNTVRESNNNNFIITVINDSTYGIITPTLNNETNSVTVDEGDNYTFTITPIEGYEITNLLIDGKIEEPQCVYTFTNIKEDHSIGAFYSKIDDSVDNIASIRLTFNHNAYFLRESDFEWIKKHNSYHIYSYPENTKIELTGKIIQLLPNEDYEYNYLYTDREKEIVGFAFNSPDNYFENNLNPCVDLVLGNLKNKVCFLGDKQEARFKIVLELKFTTTRYEDEESVGIYKKEINMIASLDTTSDNKVTLIQEDGYEDLYVKSVDNGNTFLQAMEIVFSK